MVGVLNQTWPTSNGVSSAKMLAHRIIVVIFTTMVLICPTDAFLSWLFRGNGDDNGDRSEEVEKSVPMPRGDVPFEMTTTDEKFLSEAKEHMTKDLTPLDTCHHLVSSIFLLRRGCEYHRAGELASHMILLTMLQVDRRRQNVGISISINQPIRST